MRALARLPNGDLVAGGHFQLAGGAPAARIARWDGVAWSQLGPGLAAEVKALVVLPTGELVAAGAFPERIVRWTGQQWLPLTPNPLGTEAANSLAVLPNGDLVVAGGALFGNEGVGRWNGSAWVPYAGPMVSGWSPCHRQENCSPRARRRFGGTGPAGRRCPVAG